MLKTLNGIGNWQSWRVILVLACLSILAGCGTGDPFGYVKITGKVTYDDGGLIPAQDMQLFFFPIGGAIDAKTHPRPGQAIVNCTTGEFTEVTSHKYGDGLAKGTYKVFISVAPADVVPREYTLDSKTPLEVDTANVPFLIKVPKPKK